jgi:hypothetical protein
MNTILSIYEFKYDYNLPFTERSLLELWTATEGVTFDAGAAGAADEEMSKKIKIKNAMNTILFIHEFKYDYNLPITERSFWTATKGVTFGAGVPAGVAADANGWVTRGILLINRKWLQV